MQEEFFRIISGMPGTEAKRLLMEILARLEGREELQLLFQELLSSRSNQNTIEDRFHTVHVVSGESPAGSLKVALSRGHKVIGFPDFFSMGPVWRLQEKIGLGQRREWLMDHMNVEGDYWEEEYLARCQNALNTIKSIPDQVPIFLWYGDNADEQTGLRYFLYLLQEKSNDMFLINTTESYDQHFSQPGYRYFFRHTGEISPEKLRVIYDHNKSKNPLSPADRARLVEEWQDLSETKEVLRIWEKKKITSVPENYFDDDIIKTAKKLHRKQAKKDFLKSARLIGQVLGELEQSIGDAYLEYRVRELIYRGVLEIKGIPKGMRYYSVRLREVMA